MCEIRTPHQFPTRLIIPTTTSPAPVTMSSFQPGSVENKPYVDPTPLPDHIPKVQELGVTSAPLKSAAFFIGAYCKDYNGKFQQHCIVELVKRLYILEDFMLCKAENRDPAHCLKEGRRVTRCATDLCEL